MLNLHSLAYPVTALGPGTRLALWVAGCPLRCRQCITPELWSPDKGKPIAEDTLLQHILNLSIHLDGITLSGGEPFAQAKSLSLLLKNLKQVRPEWNYLVFSGFPLSHLEQQKEMKALLHYVDILVAGAFIPELQQPHALAASSNQQVHYLTETGKKLQTACEALPINQANLALGQEQEHLLVGILQPEARNKIHQWDVKPSRF